DLPGARRYIYPPFAAMVFQLFAVFPLPIAAEILSFLNLLLLGVTFALTKRIIERTLPDRVTGPLPLVLGVVLSLVFFLDNFGHVQINEVIFVLALLGVDAHLRDRKSTRLNSSHRTISYAVFCLKQKNASPG